MGDTASSLSAFSDTSEAIGERKFTWQIPQYRRNAQTLRSGNHLQSIPFSFDGNSKIHFFLRIYPKSDKRTPSAEIGKWTSVFLYANCSRKCKVNYHVELSILDADGAKFVARTSHKKCDFKKGVGYRQFILQSELEDRANCVLPNDVLTIYCHVKELKDDSTVCRCPRENLSNVRRLRQYSKDIAALFDDETMADFTFKVKNCVIAAHKIIVGARSPVFAAMFKGELKEKSEMEVRDMKPVVFNKLLQFIYANDCDVGEFTEELLIAADKYDVKDLKELCEEEQRTKLTVDNAVRLLILSDKCQTKMLKNTVIQFISVDAKEFFIQNESLLFSLKQSAPHLFIEIHNKMLKLNL
jgi:speckle-type POZ protein